MKSIPLLDTTIPSCPPPGSSSTLSCPAWQSCRDQVGASRAWDPSDQWRSGWRRRTRKGWWGLGSLSHPGPRLIWLCKVPSPPSDLNSSYHLTALMLAFLYLLVLFWSLEGILFTLHPNGSITFLLSFNIWCWLKRKSEIKWFEKKAFLILKLAGGSDSGLSLIL